MQLSLDVDRSVIHSCEIDHEKMKHVILDPYSLKTVHATYEPLQSTNTTNGVTITLDPVEDLFLDFGGSHHLTYGSLDWDAKSVLSKNTATGFQILRQKNDRAWVQYILDRRDGAINNSEAHFIASPLSLKIHEPINGLMQYDKSVNIDANNYMRFTILLLFARNGI